MEKEASVWTYRVSLFFKNKDVRLKYSLVAVKMLPGFTPFFLLIYGYFFGTGWTSIHPLIIGIALLICTFLVVVFSLPKPKEKFDRIMRATLQVVAVLLWWLGLVTSIVLLTLALHAGPMT